LYKSQLLGVRPGEVVYRRRRGSYHDMLDGLD
jgi:hypothetical protein